jgi:hypothetical protein
MATLPKITLANRDQLLAQRRDNAAQMAKQRNSATPAAPASPVEAPLAPPVAPPVSVTRATQDQVNEGMIDPSSGQITQPTPTVTTSTGVAQQAETPGTITANTAEAATTGDKVEGVLDKVTLDKNATVQGQLENLQAGFVDGKAPAWAAGALRSAEDAAAARGLGSSSIAAAARTQAALEAALPIAQQDANAFLQVNLQKNEARINSLFTDVAIENATRQFNATSENQVKQFNTNLKSQVEQFNKAQSNAMIQFNADEENATSQFRAEMENQRQQFNAQNRLIIDQSNAQWRRSITTADNAEANEANRLSSQLIANMSLAEYNNNAQERRDKISYAFTSQENKENRALEITLANMTSSEASKDRKSESKKGLFESVGKLVGSLFG